MRRKQHLREEKRREIALHHQTWTGSVDTLALREVYPPEEFAGFENFGESPEWHPGQVDEESTANRRDQPSVRDKISK